MADTGYNWDADWTTLRSSVELVEGGTISDTGEANEVDLDNKAACLLSIVASYSDDALVVGGLVMTLRRDIDDVVWETKNASSLTFEMPFAQNDDAQKTIVLSAAQFQKLVIQGDWGNDTVGSIVSYDIRIKYATIPLAS